MIVKTKKHQLEPSKYIGIATKALLKTEIKWVFIPIVLLALGFVFPDAFWWFFSFGIAVPALYLLFWWIQFAGFTQQEASKMFFMRMNFEIDSRYILMCLSAKDKAPIEWKNFKKAYRGKKAFFLSINKANFLYLPLSIFKTENDIKLFETILKRKGLIKE